MSLNSIFGSGLSGLQAAQAGLKVVSQNISNANTPGYVRADLNLTANTLGREGGGVAISSITRAADQFLAAAALNAASARGQAGIRADLLGRAQSAFGDPTSNSSVFAALDSVFSSLTTLATDSSNTLRRSAAIGAIGNFLTSAAQVSAQLRALQVEAEDRLNEHAQSASVLLQRISDLNKQIATVRGQGGDATGLENAQSQAIDELSGFIDVKIALRDLGGVTVRTAAGALLVGDSAAQISYAPAAQANAPAGVLSLIDANGVSHPFEGLFSSGSIAGLLQARDRDLPQLALALGALTGAAADALNAAHNDASSVPAPMILAGRNTGLLGGDRLGFTGAATIAVTDAAGVMTHKIQVDFAAGALTLDGVTSTFGGPGATITQFVSGLNTALSSLGGSATFANGALTLSAGAGSGLVVQQDAGAPAGRGGRGFAHFFGLNDIVTRAQPLFFETGFAGTDAHGLSGGAIGFQVKDSTGRVVANRSVAVTGTTWADQIAALNAAGTGLGSYGAFAFDASGALSATAAQGYSIEFTADTTQRGATGLSMSQLFGFDRASTAGRADDMGVAARIAGDPSLLAVARPDLSGALNTRVLETGDSRGALALAGVADRALSFAAQGAMAAQSATLSVYAARLGGEAGRRAADAANAKAGAEALSEAASAQRSSVEGVKLDEELVKMTQYQQSYAAASRLIQAAKDMFDILLAIK